MNNDEMIKRIDKAMKNINTLHKVKKYPKPFMAWFIDSGISQTSIDVAHLGWLAGKAVTDQERIEELLENVSIKGIENITKRYNGKFYSYPEEIINKQEENDLARDLQHSGPKQNLVVAKLMYEDIKW